ncbi:MAG: HD domain-containing phosphohydrolase [Phycisphaerae bacterium]
MCADGEYRRITLAAAQALAGDADTELALYLPPAGQNVPVLYHEADAIRTKPDFERMRAQGVSHVYIRPADLGWCEQRIEDRLDDVMRNPDIPTADKAWLIQGVGTSVAGGLVAQRLEPVKLDRAVHLLNAVIDSVLADPVLSAHMLQLAAHERSATSHMFMVAALAVMLGAEALGDGDRDALRELGLAGLLHDIGKLAISPEVLNKPTPPTPNEWQIIQQHPIEAVRMIGDDPLATLAVRQMILQHHERVDGRGYPIGLTSGELLPGSRILSIVDTFHAMLGRRHYRAALSPAEANRLIKSQARRQLDADLLACWGSLFARHWCHQVFRANGHGQRAGDDEIAARHEHRCKPPAPKGPRSRPQRFDCRGSVTVRCVYAGRLVNASRAPNEFVAAVHDLSRGGLCLYTAHPMYRGEVLHIHVATGEDKVWVRGTIAWCRRQTSNVYQTGIKFVYRIEDEQVRDPVPVMGLHEADVGARAPLGGNANGRDPQSRPQAGKPQRVSALDTLAAIASMPRIDAIAERTVITLSMSGETHVRLSAIEVLMRIPTRAAGQAVINLLGDADPEVRGHAAAAVGALRLAYAADAVAKLLTDNVPIVALRGAAALGQLGDHRGLDVIVRYLHDDGPHARFAARAFGDVVGHRFTATTQGVADARRYYAAKRSTLQTR